MVKFLLPLLACGTVALAADQHQTWSTYGGGHDQSKFSDLHQITKENVSQLEIAWMYSNGDERSYEFNPLIAHGIMYVLAKDSSLVALDLDTGEELWIHANLNGISRRGMNYWESEDGSDRRLVFTLGNTIQEIDARTGQSILTFGDNGSVNLSNDLLRDPDTIFRAVSSTPGRVFENLFILGSATGEGYLSAPGHVRAYDVVTGEFVWRFNTIPQPGEYGYDTWPPEAYRYIGGVNVWGEMSVDAERGIVYLPIGSPTYDYYGADRHGANLFGNCLVALNARTGERIWHFQTVHHDLWDYDLTAAPQLITVDHDGERVDAVALATKQGFMFAFNRVTGEPLFPIEEKPFPDSPMPGEQAWPTQPIPSIPAYARQTLTPEDVSSVLITPAERADWQERIAKARKGLYTPPSTEETIAIPGAVGGTNWGGTASYPAKGMVYLLNQDYPSFYQLSERTGTFRRPGAPNTPEQDASIARGEPLYATYCAACHGANRLGGDVGPSLVAVGNQISSTQVARSIMYGAGRMPPLPHFTDEQINDVYNFLADRADPSTARGRPAPAEDLPDGPVVASGGAPQPAATGGPRPRPSSDYPEGVDVPPTRYFTGYGLGNAWVIQPPWSEIIAYDLNQGEIRWRQPLGVDPDAVAQGFIGTGLPHGAQRMSLSVTATGIVFATSKDGYIRGYDADNGALLWEGKLPAMPKGIPAMYEHNGRQYLVVCATTPVTWGLNSNPDGRGATDPWSQGGYVAFALPEQ